MSPASHAPTVTSTLAAGFDNVREVFFDLFRTGEEIGASVSVWRDGQPLVELHAGWQDAGRQRPWCADTLAMTYSTGKPFAALAALKAVELRHLTLDAPITRWWPEFGQHNKSSTTLRHILSHTAGLPAFSEGVRTADPLDSARLIADLVSQEPLWAPGQVIAEHALTYGHLIEGALAAGSADDVRTAVAEFAREFGADFWFGVPEELLGRVADLEIMDQAWVGEYLQRDLSCRALTIPTGRLDPRHTNTAASRRATFPADGLITNASGLARFYDDLPRRDGTLAEYLGPQLHEEFTKPQATGFDHFLESSASWSLGLRVDGGGFGMGGIGGSCAWYDPGLDYSMAYVTRGLGTFDRVDALATAVENAIGGL